MDADVMAYIFGAFFLAALTKGITGLGFSTLCLPLLALVLTPTVSIPLVIVPSLCSNVLVMAGAGSLWLAFKRFWPLYLAALPGLGLGLWLLHHGDSSVGRFVLGVALLSYALWALFSRPVCLMPAVAQGLAIPVGFTTGVINGLTGSQVMPILPYLLALNLEPDLFVTAINGSFTLSSLVMLLGLSRFGLMQGSLLGVAGAGTFVVALGIMLGTRVRQRLAPERYRQLLLLLLIGLGISLVLKAWV